MARDCSKKVRSAYRTKAYNGEYTGPYAPYGYQKDPADKHHLIPDERAPVIRKMFQMALEGNTCFSIAKELEREQVLTPRASIMVKTGKYVTEDRQKHPYSWSARSVEELLTNPVYLGRMVAQKCSTRSFKDKRMYFRPPEEWIVVENTHEPLIDQATFDTVQERLKVKKPDWTHNPRNIYRGLLYCGECGLRMVFSSTMGHRHGSTGMFGCAKFRRYGGNECTSHYIHLEELNEVVLGDIRRHAALASADRDRYMEYLMRVSEQERNGGMASWQKELSQSQRRLAELDVIIRRMYEDSVFGRIPPERYSLMSESYEAESRKLRERCVELQRLMESYGKHSKGSQDFADLVAQYTDIRALSEELLNTLIERVVVHEKEVLDGQTFMRVEIYYRFIGRIGGESGEDLMAQKYRRGVRGR